ncbi:type 1 glutamine amidotransferase domain-containing protein [Luteimonas arsenica]|uniref:type 1 glutamine amidotransferase domain-containing protein n=1 Tax=Luteimonas arsenica TaxID=1586242 RepID=UPI001055B5EF|nr:type 1 glutamine amidotransferase domain-containing protein [Luteimonas arsenica]
MKRFLLSTVLTLSSIVFLAAPAAAADKVLIVVSGEGRDGGKARPGYEFDELSQAWLVFTANGLEVDVASPRGGAVEADRYDPADPFNAALLADEAAMRTLADTRATADLEAGDYAAVYVVGGKGAMFDLPFDPALQRLLADAWEAGAVVAAVCHGPAALAEVRLSDGSRLVEGRALTGFSNEEEAIFGKKWAKEFPWHLETALRERGARWSNAPLMMPHLVVDGRLVTGQNPYSTVLVAEAIVRGTGRTPVAREPWRDEATIALAEQLHAGDAQGAARKLAAAPGQYHVELLGALGYYQGIAATTPEGWRRALQVVELALPYFQDPQMKVAAAGLHVKLGQQAQARALLLQALEAKPGLEQAEELLRQIDG